MVFAESKSGSIILDIENLTKIVRGTHRVALSDVTLKVEAGQVLGLVGDNRTSRATLFRLILGLQTPDSGSLRIFGQDCVSKSPKLNNRIGFLPENIELKKNISAIQYLKLIAGLSGIQEEVAATRIAKYSEMLHFGDYLGTSIRKLSKSERRCLVFIGSLIHDPELLLLEEPVKDLSLVMRKAVRRLIADFSAKGNTVIISSDDLPFLEQVTGDLAIFAEGHIAFQGSLASIRDTRDIPALSVSFSGSADKFENELRIEANRGILSYRFATDTCDIYFDPEMFLSERLRVLLAIIENSETVLLDLRPSAADLGDAVDGIVDKFRETRVSKLVGLRQAVEQRALDYSEADLN